MTKASEILATARDCSEGMDLAEKFAVETDQDWYNESTIYTFEDGSVLLAIGPWLNAYAGAVLPQYFVGADSATGEWTSEAEFLTYVECKAWGAMIDTDDVQHDTYEFNGQARAIEVNFVHA